MKKTFIHTALSVSSSRWSQSYFVIILSLLIGLLTIPEKGVGQDPIEQIRVIATNAKVLEGPGSDYTVIITLSQGTILILLEKDEDWFKIQLTPEFGTDAEYGFIHDLVVEVLGESSETEDFSEISPLEDRRGEDELYIPDEPEGTDPYEETEPAAGLQEPTDQEESDEPEQIETSEDHEADVFAQSSQNFWDTVPPLSLTAGLNGWGGSLQHAGFELAAGAGSKPVQYRLVWSRGIWGSSFDTEWIGLEIQSFVGRIGSGELRFGVAGGRYSEIRTFSSGADGNENGNGGGSQTRITERDATFGLVVSARWPLAAMLPGTELEITLRWLAGISDDEEYHIPVMRAALGFSSDRISPRIWPRTSRLAIYLAGGMSNGRAVGDDLLRPAARFGLDITIGELELRLMSAAQIQDELFAPSAGSAIMVSVVPGQSLSLYLGAGARWYNEILEEERHHAWFGGLMGELRYRLGGRVSLTLTGERSWGFAEAGHLVSMDDLSLGLRTIIWR